MRPGLAAACALAALACARGAPAPGTADGPPPADTVRGIVRVVGSEPATLVVLRTAAGASVTLLGERRLLERVAGLEVRVDGAPRPGGRFQVERLTVRAAEGVPAVDGVLVREGERWFLLTTDGRRLPVARLPAALRGRAGARVWLAGPLDRPPAAFGVLADPAGR